MSFYIDFYARDLESATHRIEDSYLPEAVRKMLLEALGSLHTDLGVHVTASGHLSNGAAGEASSCSFLVAPIMFAKPRSAAQGMPLNSWNRDAVPEE